jgi:hypothetical protein
LYARRNQPHISHNTLGENKANVKWRFGIYPAHYPYPSPRPYASISSVTQAPQRSGAVTAAAIIAIVGSACAILIWGWLMYDLSRMIRPNGEPVLATVSVFVVAITLIPPVLALLGLQTGLGLLRLHPWSRKSALVWAAASLLGCAVLMVRFPYEIFIIDKDHFRGDVALMAQFFVQGTLILLVPTNIWWLILFTRKSVKAQFEPPPSRPSS